MLSRIRRQSAPPRRAVVETPAARGRRNSAPEARTPLRTIQACATPLVDGKRAESWFSEGGDCEGPARDDLEHAGFADADAMELVCLVARDICARLPVCRYDAVTRTYAVVTALATRSGATRVQARVPRDLRAFARLRRELLVVLPELSSVVPAAALDVDGVAAGAPPLPRLPTRTLRRKSTRDAAAKDVKTMSGDGSTAWFVGKEAELTAWIRDTLRVFQHVLALAGTSSSSAKRDAKGRAEALLIAFLLRSAKVAVRRHSAPDIVKQAPP